MRPSFIEEIDISSLNKVCVLSHFRKGLIKLTGLPYEIDNPEYFDDRKERKFSFTLLLESHVCFQ